MITVAGEALVDLVLQPDGTLDAALGGAPFNAARAAARLGAPVEYVGVLSTDRFGRRLADQLAADGVGTTSAMRTDLPTTLALAELDEGGAATYRFYIDATSAPTLGTVQLGDPPDIFFTGGLGLVLEPMATAIVSAVDGAPRDMLVMVDVNCRPNVIADRSTYLGHVERVLARADIAKLSDEDLAYLAPGAPPIDAARQLVSRGVPAILVTAGSAATAIVTGGGVVEVPVPAPPGPVIDTIGAGDTFGGGLLAWWSATGLARSDIATGDHLVGAVRAAQAAAAIVVTRRGADPPTRDDLPADWDRGPNVG